MGVPSFFFLALMFLLYFVSLTRSQASLSQARSRLAATSVENLAFFAGGFADEIFGVWLHSLPYDEHVS
jgi:hypothetical protein